MRDKIHRNAAEHLRGKDIFALRDDMPPLPEDRFYIADLTGCAVVASSGEEIGEVVSVTPARTDIYTITTTKGEVSPVRVRLKRRTLRRL